MLLHSRRTGQTNCHVFSLSFQESALTMGSGSCSNPRVRHPRTRLRLYCIGACVWLLQAAASTETCAQGTVLFRNYYWHYEGTNAWREDRPIFLADGVTRAQGSNVVVELWVRDPLTEQLRFADRTHLYDGDRAGLFEGGSGGM